MQDHTVKNEREPAWYNFVFIFLHIDIYIFFFIFFFLQKGILLHNAGTKTVTTGIYLDIYIYVSKCTKNFKKDNVLMLRCEVMKAETKFRDLCKVCIPKIYLFKLACLVLIAR